MFDNVGRFMGAELVVNNVHPGKLELVAKNIPEVVPEERQIEVKKSDDPSPEDGIYIDFHDGTGMHKLNVLSDEDAEMLWHTISDQNKFMDDSIDALHYAIQGEADKATMVRRIIGIDPSKVFENRIIKMGPTS
jgi:alanine racemase